MFSHQYFSNWSGLGKYNRNKFYFNLLHTKLSSPSYTENSRSASLDWHNFIRTGIKYEIVLHILLFGLALY